KRDILLGLAMIFLGRVVAGDPGADYMLHCRGCHGPDGRGVVDGAPPFGPYVGKFVNADAGREYLLRVPGVTQSELDDARTAELLNWLVHEFAAPSAGDFVPFSAAEVAAHRRMTLIDVGTARARLLRSLP